MSAEKSILFICGSMNQTTQMLQISRHLTEYRQAFTPFYCEGLQEAMRRLKLLEFTIIGAKLVARCHRYLRASGLAIDYQGRRGPYDLVVTCSDVFVQKNIRGQKVVLVQEGITDPETAAFRLVQRHRSLPRWLAGTAATGLSDVYRAFCVASEGYRDLFIGKGAKAEKIVVTGIPNFDHCERYLDNTFPHRHYVLVCTSPLREIFRGEDRPSFIRNAVAIANGRPMIFKFHPSEDLVRAQREVRQYAPGALTFSDGSAEEMIANCDVLITRYSSTAFVGLALGKETHSDFPADELRRLLPVQNNAAAANIADVCRRVIDDNRYPVRRAITVRAVTSWRDRRSFQQLPWTIYANDPNWVPPILSQERGLLGWERHPFFDHAEMVTLLAERGGEAVGRIAVFVNDVHNAKYDEQRGFFGFFECVDDVAVARELFDAGRAWLLQRGMTAWRGPVNLSLNYTCGLLIDGFGSPPVFLMTYNPRYYAALIEACGFAKAQDLYAYEMDVPLLAKLVDRYKPAVVSALDGDDLVVRRFDRSRLAAEIATFLEVYNRALEGTWGFTPLQEREAKHIAAEMGHIIAPEFAAFALVDGKVVGAVLALLDYNQIIRKLDGRLLPFGILRLMRGRKRINVARAMAMTMVPGYQQSGISIVLLDRLVEAAKPWGLKGWEFSWVLESNDSSRGTLRRLGTKLAKTYRIYDQAL